MKKLSDCCKADIIEKNNEGTFCSDCGMECDVEDNRMDIRKKISEILVKLKI